MATERAARQPLRIVGGRPAQAPILDLAATTRVYAQLLDQSRELQSVLDELRGRILRAMEEAEVGEFDADGYRAIRQVRHFGPRLDEVRAEAILRSVGRLDEAQRVVIDPTKARQVLAELFAQGAIQKEDLPFTESREVEALIVRSIEESSESSSEPGASEPKAQSTVSSPGQQARR